MNRICKAILATGLWACLPMAWAHGGEDHDHDKAAPAAAISAGPSEGGARASTATESFEMVIALSKDEAKPTMTLYIDRFATNEALRDATVEVESGSFKGVAKPVAPGVYQLPGQAFSTPGQHPITVSVQAGDEADLLDVMLDTTHPEPTQHAPIHHTRTWAWALAGAMALVMAGLIMRRRRATRPHTSQDLT